MKSMSKKTVIVALCVVLVLMAAAGGTLAWLRSEASGGLTFSGGANNPDHVTVTLHEVEGNFTHVIPGQVLNFDPTVTVNASVDAFAFVQIDDAIGILGSSALDGWTALNGVDNVYYRLVSASDAAQTFPIFTNGQIKVNMALSPSVASSDQSIGIQAYAIQAHWLNDTEDSTPTVAWEILNSTESTVPDPSDNP